MPHQLTLIAGDGIGPEVAEATVEVLKHTGVRIDWDRQLAGLCAVEATGKALPDATIESLKRNVIGLKGPTTTPVGTGHGSANVALRRKMDLFASVRPVKTVPGVPTRYDNVDLVIFRENTEGLYSGLEHEVSKGVIVSTKVVTEFATRRIARAAFEYAKDKGRKRVTVVHKANIMKLGDGFFLQVCKEVSRDYPQIKYDEAIIDSLCMRMVRNPEEYDILVMENLYGDIISDLCAGLVGGLGVVPGANIGAETAIFEAVHGAAPDIAGKGLANPTALMKSAVMMLEHIGELSASERLNMAIDKVLGAGKVRTGDLGGNASTMDFAKAVAEAL